MSADSPLPGAQRLRLGPEISFLLRTGLLMLPGAEVLTWAGSERWEPRGVSVHCQHFSLQGAAPP